MTQSLQQFPLVISGHVVKGFGRGSKELGIPTANFPDDVVLSKCSQLENGIYYGWATVADAISNDNAQLSDSIQQHNHVEADTLSDRVYPMVMSVGWNPYYKNEKQSAEVHIIHKFDNDFYGQLLTVAVLGYIRPERDFESLDALIKEIHSDIETAQRLLKSQQDQKRLIQRN
ncbi:hypothetical protein MIR68_002708 [Amoeboaphelidium protococcarum]|nr:hypothetical protein MIR68_002708 [Amoeboaphelidium protococcarum]